jgi:predicted P-loop ATPase
LRCDRNQLFAEAVYLFRQGERWWPDKAFEAKWIQPEQDKRYEADPWEDVLIPYLHEYREKPLLISDIARGALTLLDVHKIGTHDARRIAAILEREGWERGPRLAHGRFWIKKPKEPKT